MAIARLLAGHDAEALIEATLIHAPGQVWGPLWRALAHAGLGHIDRARIEWAEALDIQPNLLDDADNQFRVGLNLSDAEYAVIRSHLVRITAGS